MASSSSSEIKGLAYAKIVGHCYNHPYGAVNGILLGSVGKREQGAGAGEEGDNSGHSSVVVSDCLPLCHTMLELAPVVEAALMQAEALARAKKCEIVGYYHADEHCDKAILT